ncbi:unnamed protein product [Arabidopsis halleri]
MGKRVFYPWLCIFFSYSLFFFESVRESEEASQRRHKSTRDVS